RARRRVERAGEEREERPVRVRGEPQRLGAPALRPDETGPRLFEEERLLRVDGPPATGALASGRHQARQLQDPDVEIRARKGGGGPSKECVHDVVREAIERLGGLRLRDEGLEALRE